MTAGEQNLLADLNEFVRQTSDLLEDEPQTTGIRPNPVIEVTEQTLDTSRFGFQFGPLPETEVLPTGGGGPPIIEGACCAFGTCFQSTEPECVGSGGVYEGDGVPCDPDPCVGACCFCDGTCSMENLSDCFFAGGNFNGVGVDCDSVTCTPFGACCTEGGSCDIRTESDCTILHRCYQGNCSDCSGGAPCGDLGACCLPDGGCVTGAPVYKCRCDHVSGGTFYEGEGCGQPGPCYGACWAVIPCDSSYSESDCTTCGGTWFADVDCNGDPSEPGVCKHIPNGCFYGVESDCTGEGIWQGYGSVCSDASKPPCCPSSCGTAPCAGSC